MKPERNVMNKRMIQMMMVLGIGGIVMFSSRSQALSLNLSFCNGGISLRLDDDEHRGVLGKKHQKQAVKDGRVKLDNRREVPHNDKHKAAMNKKSKKHDKRR